MSRKEPKPVDLAELRMSLSQLSDRPNATVMITARWLTELIDRTESAEAKAKVLIDAAADHDFGRVECVCPLCEAIKALDGAS